VAALVVASEVVSPPGGRRAVRRRLLWLAGVPLLSQLGLQALRWAWFGHLLPNSVLYKTGTDALAAVPGRFLVETAPIAPLAVARLALVRGRVRLLAVVPLADAVASLTFRDSVNTYSRLVLAGLPPLLLLAGAALPGALTLIPEAWPRRAAVLATGTSALVGYAMIVGPTSIRDAAARADAYSACQAAARQLAGE
jgi:arabinofuranosyltransferase